MENIEDILIKWGSKLHNFQLQSAYKSAVALLKDYDLNKHSLSNVVQTVLPQHLSSSKWDRLNPNFQKYGLFISAMVNSIKEEGPVLVRICEIEKHLKKEKGDEWYDEFGDRTRLRYLGYRNDKSMVVYDGDAGDDFCLENKAGIVLTGNAEDRAGKKQQGKTIVIFGDVKNYASEQQERGIMIVVGKAKNHVGKNKTNGDTHILGGPAGRFAGQNMSGGRLFLPKGAGDWWADGAKGNARIYLSGPLGRHSGTSRGKIFFTTQIRDDAKELLDRTIERLDYLGIDPYYH